MQGGGGGGGLRNQIYRGRVAGRNRSALQIKRPSALLGDIGHCSNVWLWAPESVHSPLRRSYIFEVRGPADPNVATFPFIFNRSTSSSTCQELRSFVAQSVAQSIYLQLSCRILVMCDRVGFEMQATLFGKARPKESFFQNIRTGDSPYFAVVEALWQVEKSRSRSEFLLLYSEECANRVLAENGCVQ